MSSWRGRGRGGRGRGGADSAPKRFRIDDGARNSAALSQALVGLQGAPYPAYKDLAGAWAFDRFTLYIDHVQADPYASPSKVRIRVSHADAGFDASLYANKIRKTALADYLHRRLHQECASKGYEAASGGQGWAGSKGGDIRVDSPTAQVLERTAVVVTGEHIEARIACGLPAKGRSIEGRDAETLLCQRVPDLAKVGLFAASQDQAAVRKHVESVEDQAALRDSLASHNLVAFVRNGAVLPRASGSSSRPLTGPDVVPFKSPKSLAVTLDLPSSGAITGMGIPARSLVVVIGAGFHGKSTLLEAIRLGCYNYQPGDGREFVSARADVTSVQSEEGRQISHVDVSNFIKNLPGRVSTHDFSTTNASGSTSCSAGAIEALEVGSKLLCIDEDTTASNWLSCPRVMTQLVGRETIQPLEARARGLVESTSATIVIACGSSVGFLAHADVVIKMDEYRCFDVTKEAREFGGEAVGGEFAGVGERRFDVASLRGKVAGKVMARGTHAIQLGGEGDESAVEVRALPQVMCESQVRGVIAALKHLGGREGSMSAAEAVRVLEVCTNEELLQVRAEPDGFIARPRGVDVVAVMNRIRGLAWVGGGAK